MMIDEALSPHIAWGDLAFVMVEVKPTMHTELKGQCFNHGEDSLQRHESFNCFGFGP